MRDFFEAPQKYALIHGLSLEKVIDELHFWGLAHRQEVIGISTTPIHRLS